MSEEPKTCGICGDESIDFCENCKEIIANDDGFLIDVCLDCCTCVDDMSQLSLIHI